MNPSPVAMVVRGWVDLYTRGLPPEARAARRDEIDDDLWSQQEEAALLGRSPRSLGPELLMRLLWGIPSDLTWRLAQRASRGGAPTERSSTVSTRLFGALAIIGGATWGTLAIMALVSDLDEVALVPVVAAIGGIAFGVAAIGLAWRFQDQLSAVGALGGMFAGLGVLLSTLGAYPLNILLPIGSAALAWELGRAGILPRWVAIIHALTAVAFLVTVTGAMVDYSFTYRSGLLITLAIPYLASWIAIGASLVRGVPMAAQPAPTS